MLATENGAGNSCAKKGKGRISMKKTIALGLAAALLLALPACGSGGGELAPFTKNYDSAEELTDMLIAHYTGSDEQLRAIEKNTAIHHFFSEDEADNQIARTLYAAKQDADQQEHNDRYGITDDMSQEEIMAIEAGEVPAEENEAVERQGADYSGADIYSLYAVCNEDSQWYNTLAIGDGPAPLMLFGLSSPYFSYTAYGDLSYAAIADGIRDFFKDPQSVTVEDVTLYPALLDDPDALQFSAPMKFAMVITVRAANDFGAYSSGDYLFLFSGRSYSLDGPFTWDGLSSPRYLDRLGFQSGGWSLPDLETAG